MIGHSSILELTSRHSEGLFGDVIVRNAFLYPDREAYVYGDQRLTFKQFNKRVNSLTHALLQKGLKKGDVLGVLSLNCIDFMDVFGAAEKAGFIIAPFNTRLSANELQYIIDNSEAKVLFVGDEFAEMAEALRLRLTKVKHYIAFDKGIPGMEHHGRLLESYLDEEPAVKAEEDDPLFICYTSGTTGRPRGALYTQGRFREAVIGHTLDTPVSISSRAAGLTPLFHIAQIMQRAFMFYAGGTTVLIRLFEPGDLLATIEREKITNLVLVPTQLAMLLDHPDFGKYDLSSIKRIDYAASPMPIELLKRGIEVFGPIFCQGYGSTEAGPQICSLPAYDHDVLSKPELQYRLLSCGRPVIGVHVRIVDENGRDVAPGEVGEIIAKSRHLMNCYWNNPEATQKRIVDGWLHTGDLGRYDEDGFIYIIDRKEDMIISGGENIYPRDVEEVLYQHPAVRECSVIGVPDQKWVERVHAVVALRSGYSATVEELMEFCKKRIARYKAPKSLEIVNELPKNATGKILRRVLKETYLSGKKGE